MARAFFVGGVATRLLAVEIEFARRLAKNLRARRFVRNGFGQPIYRRLVRKLALVPDKWTVAGPDQTVGPSDAQEFASVVDRLRAEPVAARDLHPGAALLDGLQ